MTHVRQFRNLCELEAERQGLIVHAFEIDVDDTYVRCPVRIGEHTDVVLFALAVLDHHEPEEIERMVRDEFDLVVSRMVDELID